jgi:proteic killer suppression protein
MHSVSINLSYRITLELLIEDNKIIPLNVGDHDAVY